MTEQILIVGAGGHGHVVADTLLQMIDAGADLALLGFLDDDITVHGETIFDLPIFGSPEELRRIPHDLLIVAIGDNKTRRELFLQFSRSGERFASAIHPQAIIANDVTFGPGCVIMAGSIINTGARIGDNVILNTGCTVDHHCSLAAHVHVAPGCHLGGDVIVGEGGFMGIGATVMPGRTIGAWATVGAATLAHLDVPDEKTIVGVPGRILEKDIT